MEFEIESSKSDERKDPLQPSCKPHVVGQSATSSSGVLYESRLLTLINPGVNILLFLCTIFALYGWWNWKNELPETSMIDERLYTEPHQQSIHADKFEFSYGRKEYIVEPLAEYELHGLIVSHNEPAAFGDIYHDEFSVDFRDLCVVWGENLENGIFRKVTFWNETWTCHVRIDSREDARSFKSNQFSNNHILSNSEFVKRVILKSGVGDQIYLRGYLVNYAPKAAPQMLRRSSLVRTDDGNGACEVFFVTEASIIRKAASFRRSMYDIGCRLWIFLIICKILLFLFMPLQYYKKY